MKKVISLILAICMTLVVCIPSASAEDVQPLKLETISADDMGLVSGSTEMSVTSAEDGIDPQITVYEGANAFIINTVVYPAAYIDGMIRYAPELYEMTSFAGNTSGGTLRVSSARTQEMIDIFRKGTGVAPTMWLMQTRFNVINDRWGSYGRYFEFSPDGNIILPETQSNGKVRYDLTRTVVDQDYILTSVFSIPSSTTGRYSIGLSGGFWYYNINAHKDLSQAVHTTTYFNWDA